MTVDEKIFTTIAKMKIKQDTMAIDLADIKAKVSVMPCAVNTLKINTIRKVVYGAVGIILLAFMGNIITPLKTSQADINLGVKVEKTIIEDKDKHEDKTN